MEIIFISRLATYLLCGPSRKARVFVQFLLMVDMQHPWMSVCLNSPMGDVRDSINPNTISDVNLDVELGTCATESLEELPNVVWDVFV